MILINCKRLILMYECRVVYLVCFDKDLKHKAKLADGLKLINFKP